MKKANYYRELLAAATGSSGRFYSAVVFICGFVFAIGLCFVLKPRFEYHGNMGIVSWISANKYPKQQETFYYAASLFFVPFFAAVVWGSWLWCSGMLSRFTGLSLHETMRRYALAYLPLVLILRNISAPAFSKTLLAPLILLVIAKIIVIIHALSRTRFRRIREAVFHPGSWNTHWSVFTSGVCVGFFALIGYSAETMGILPCLKTVLMSAVLLWLFWMLYSRALSAVIKRPFSDILAGEACSYFPLAVLPLVSLFFGHKSVILIISLVSVVSIKAALIIKPGWFEKLGSRQLHKYVLTYALIPALIYAFFYSGGDIHGGVDMFHEGERLAPLNALLRGKLPYRDIYLQHGLFHNAYRPLLAAKLFGSTLAADRMLEHIIDPLRCVAFYLFALQILKSRFFVFLSIWILASGRTYDLARRALSVRGALGLIGMAVLVDYALKQRRRLLYKFHLYPLLAGVCVTLNIFYSLEMGLYALATGFLFLLIFSTSLRGSFFQRSLPLLSYIAGAFVALLPFALYFTVHGAIGDLVGNSLIQCRYHIPTWGLKFPPLFPELVKIASLESLRVFVLGETFEWYFPVLVYLITLTYLAYQVFRGGFWNRDSNALLLFLAIGGIISFRTPLGRSDRWHLYGTFFAWLIFILMLRSMLTKAWRELKGGSQLIPAAAWRLFLALVFLWYVYYLYNPVTTVRERLLTLTGYQSIERNVEPQLDRAGGITLPEAQASQIKTVVEYIQDNTAPDETIFDFSSQGAYYFFADRPMASRYHQVCYASTEAMQREVIRDLERHRTKLVIFTTGGGFDGIDQVPSVDRHPLIAKYLRENYTEAAKVGKVTMLKRKIEERK